METTLGVHAVIDVPTLNTEYGNRGTWVEDPESGITPAILSPGSIDYNTGEIIINWAEIPDVTQATASYLYVGTIGIGNKFYNPIGAAKAGYVVDPESTGTVTFLVPGTQLGR